MQICHKKQQQQNKTKQNKTKKQFCGTSLQRACWWQRQEAVAESWLFWGGGGMQLETSFGKKGKSVCTSLFESKLVEILAY